MKKILFMLAFMCAIVSANAQVALENPKWYDNWSVGVTCGVSTPLDFHSVMPLNTYFGVQLQKDLTPTFGLQVEGLAFVNDNHFADKTSPTWVKATDVNVNGVLNWSNIISGYKGTPRLFEISTVTGLGWLCMYDNNQHYLSAKTGVDLSFNLGKTKAHSIVVSPSIYWNLSGGSKIQFNKTHAQLALGVGYRYHFLTSNGTHSFKLYDIDAMNSKINELRGANSNLKAQVIGLENANNKLKSKNGELIAENEHLAKYKNDGRTWTVEFAQGSSDLSSEAKTILDKVSTSNSVTVLGSASPEGSSERNQSLSENRVKSVVSYLESNGVKVANTSAVGAKSSTSNRLVLVSISK